MLLPASLLAIGLGIHSKASFERRLTASSCLIEGGVERSQMRSRELAAQH